MSNYCFPVAKADAVNGCKRIYPREVLQRAVDLYQRNHKGTRSLLGELGQPAESIISLKNASHVVTDLRLDGDYLMAEVEVLDTPAGKVLQQLLDMNVKVAFRPRGIGGGKVDDSGVLTVGDSYKLITIDALDHNEAKSIE